MERLTNNHDETKNWQYLTNGGQLVDKKLGKLEDILEKHDIDVNQLDDILTECAEHKKIEKDLGIDLVTLIKALFYGVYDIKNSYRVKYALIGRYEDETDYFLFEREIFGTNHFIGYIKDFGKTWALTKEQLE